MRYIAGAPLRVYPDVGYSGIFHLCPAPGELSGVRSTRGTDALGGGQAPTDRHVRLVSGGLGQTAELEGSGRGFQDYLGSCVDQHPLAAAQTAGEPDGKTGTEAGEASAL